MSKKHMKNSHHRWHKGNANQNHTSLLLTPPTKNIGEDMGKKEPHTLQVGM
jgi:hypothetical protein